MPRVGGPADRGGSAPPPPPPPPPPARGSTGALELAFRLLRPAGTLSSVGVHTAPQFPFSPVDGYNKNLTYR